MLGAIRVAARDRARLAEVIATTSRFGLDVLLARLGLDDAAAAKDMAELRELLGAWRDAKRSVWKAALAWVVRIAGALLLTGLAAKFGFWDWVK